MLQVNFFCQNKRRKLLWNDLRTKWYHTQPWPGQHGQHELGACPRKQIRMQNLEILAQWQCNNRWSKILNVYQPRSQDLPMATNKENVKTLELVLDTPKTYLVPHYGQPISPKKLWRGWFNRNSQNVGEYISPSSLGFMPVDTTIQSVSGRCKSHESECR